jgi:FMN phosphatase YigB (HAD superfamily)
MFKPIIALDIDDVVSHTAENIIAYANERWGHQHTIEDFTEHLAEMWQVDQQEAERRWHEYIHSGSMEQYDAIPGALAVLRQLQGHYRIIAVTSRREILVEMTERWLSSNYPELVERVISSNVYGKGDPHAHKRTKADILKEMGAAYLIDDQPKHCNGAAGVGVQAILFGDYPWNRDVELADGVTRCKDWAAVEEYFDARTV